MPPRRRDSSPVPAPTDAELRILRVLWRQGASTVAQVHEVLTRDQPAGYTTTLKLLQIMLEKGLVTRDASARTHIYTAAVGETETQRAATASLLDRLFGGSAAALVQQALTVDPASRDDLRKIREMLDALERQEGSSND